MVPEIVAENAAGFRLAAKCPRFVYVFCRLLPDGAEVFDAAGRAHLVSGYLACVDGRCAVRARWKESSHGLTRVRFPDGQEVWVRVETDLQLEPAA
jgi:hypothetical protein